MLAFILLFFLVLAVITLIVKPNIKNPKDIYRKMIIFITVVLSRFYKLKVEVKGLEKIPTNKSFLLVCNHQSNVDPIVMVSALKDFKITFIMKDGIMKLPIIGRWLDASGYLPINRKNNRKAVETIVTATKRIQDNVHSIAVYPEGHRSKGPNMNEFRNGVFKIAQKAGSPIVVCALDNSYKIKKRFLFKKTTILFEVINVWEYDTFKDTTTIDLGNEIHQEIENKLMEFRKVK
jgi:1-acyl-sn-glycerol-3-phosphate acyltransferase